MEIKKVIVAPLNWGMGHAARCIPVIHELQNANYTPVLASDGLALDFLKREFPTLETLELPGYSVGYKKNLKLGLLLNSLNMAKAVLQEQKTIKTYIKNNPDVVGIVSDNRLGCFSKQVPSVYMTHQIQVKFGRLTPFVTAIHRAYIHKYKQCWVPDVEGSLFSGELSLPKLNIPKKYMGAISRLQKQDTAIEYDVLVLLSGIESQRKALEEVLLTKLSTYKGNVLFVRGTLKGKILNNVPRHITIADFMLTKDLEKAISKSALVISRSGYTTVLDVAKIGKKAIMIPTPGQTEQEYLGDYLDEKGIVLSCKQEAFSLNLIEKTQSYSGLHCTTKDGFNQKWFAVFQG